MKVALDFCIFPVYIFVLPAALCDDHFRANLMELLPELIVLQRHLYAGQRDARRHYHVPRHRYGQHRGKGICEGGMEGISIDEYALYC